MSNYEQLRTNTGHRILGVGSALILSVGIMGSGDVSASVPDQHEAVLAEKCAVEHPQTVFQRSPGYFAVSSFGVTISEMIDEQSEQQNNEYLESPERNEDVEAAVLSFVESMQIQANAGDKGYEFVPDTVSSGDKTSGSYEGYGVLKNVVLGSRGEVLQSQAANNIYRNHDGSYDLSRGATWELYVANKDASANFVAPGVGFTECAMVLGNSESRGWSIEYYDFWPLDEPAPKNAIQSATYNTSNVNASPTLEGLKKVDRRALSLVEQTS